MYNYYQLVQKDNLKLPTNWSIQIGNKSIWQCHLMLFQCMDSFMAVINHPFIFSWPGNLTYGSIDETKDVNQSCSLGRNRLCISYK